MKRILGAVPILAGLTWGGMFGLAVQGGEIAVLGSERQGAWTTFDSASASC